MNTARCTLISAVVREWCGRGTEPRIVYLLKRLIFVFAEKKMMQMRRLIDRMTMHAHGTHVTTQKEDGGIWKLKVPLIHQSIEFAWTLTKILLV